MQPSCEVTRGQGDLLPVNGQLCEGVCVTTLGLGQYLARAQCMLPGLSQQGKAGQGGQGRAGLAYKSPAGSHDKGIPDIGGQ